MSEGNIRDLIKSDLDKLTDSECGQIYRFLRRNVIANTPWKEMEGELTALRQQVAELEKAISLISGDRDACKRMANKFGVEAESAESKLKKARGAADWMDAALESLAYQIQSFLDGKTTPADQYFPVLIDNIKTVREVAQQTLKETG